jgi:YggT family protein
MNGLLVALTRDDVATYVDALFTVYFILIITRIVLSWIQQFRPIPYNMALRAVIGFIEESVDPYLNVFRRFIPPLRVGGAGLDLSPILAIIVLLIVQGLVVGAIEE